MICCAVGLFLIAQWLAWYRTAKQFLTRWRRPLMAALLLLGLQTSAFAWHLWQPALDFEQLGPDDVAQLALAGPLCGDAL